MKKILIINGPNLNLLGQRDKKNYGELTLKGLNSLIKSKYPNLRFTFKQSNYEGEIIGWLQKYQKYEAIIINAGALTHYSIALRDALEVVTIPKISVHLSNIYEREDFRKVNLLKAVCDHEIVGEKANSYLLAIDFLLVKK